MHTSDPLHVAFVWHMHQPYYRSAQSGSFDMPWVRMHALKDYGDMVETLSSYPALHQTFNLVPSLVEQLEDYASGDYTDTYWEHTLKPAAELDPTERAFVVERMCELPDHPRARSHPRYLELARKRESLAPQGWLAAARAFSTQELLDLQLWFNLAWFGDRTQTDPDLRELTARGRDFKEADKATLAACQASVIGNILSAYREAARSSQVELTTSPYFHPILPLLCDSDSARIASPNLLLPSRRFAHPEDAAQQLRSALAKHEEVFGEKPRGVWCSEMAVGESVLPLLMDLGIDWTISDEGVLTRSLSGVTVDPDKPQPAVSGTAYWPYRLTRETGEMAIVFRDHTLSDLIGFSYKSWDSREAAADLLARLSELRRTLPDEPATSAPLEQAGAARPGRRRPRPGSPLVVIALDGENAWEYYPNDGHDFLRFLYEGISADDSLRCVTISEHLRESPPRLSLDWLHTGSWVFSDLTTWCGTRAQNQAWDQLHEVRDLVARRRQESAESRGLRESGSRHGGEDVLDEAWRHVLVAEGSDWFWWFGDHHHTELDAVWDRDFRLRLQEVYRLIGEPAPSVLSIPLIDLPAPLAPAVPSGPVSPRIDGVFDPAEWEQAGHLVPSQTAAMQPSVQAQVREVRFGWHENQLCLLAAVDHRSLHEGLWLGLAVRSEDGREHPTMQAVLAESGGASVTPLREGLSAESVQVAWKDVVEISLPSVFALSPGASRDSLTVRIGLDRTTAQEFHS
jgi:alpha-amylase/alpha-mannosidase (GH57 family)